jgi:hypothetical protein
MTRAKGSDTMWPKLIVVGTLFAMATMALCVQFSGPSESESIARVDNVTLIITASLSGNGTYVDRNEFIVIRASSGQISWEFAGYGSTRLHGAVDGNGQQLVQAFEAAARMQDDAKKLHSLNPDAFIRRYCSTEMVRQGRVPL